MKHETKLSKTQVKALGLTPDQIRFCESQPYPISGVVSGENSSKFETTTNVVIELAARSKIINRFQRRLSWSNKECAKFFGVSPATWARWLSQDAVVPAMVCFKAELTLTRSVSA